VTLMIGQCAHIFNVGHRIGLTITSSNVRPDT
jgi:predicted acyl esterase